MADSAVDRGNFAPGDVTFKRERFERGDVVEDVNDHSIYVLGGLDESNNCSIYATIVENTPNSIFVGRPWPAVMPSSLRKIGHIEVPDE
jgi:hypothetical protein